MKSNYNTSLKPLKVSYFIKQGSFLITGPGRLCPSGKQHRLDGGGGSGSKTVFGAAILRRIKTFPANGISALPTRAAIGGFPISFPPWAGYSFAGHPA
jgi:hypothetical protein